MKIILSLIISFFLIFVSSISYANDVTLDNDNWYKSSAPASNDFTLEAIFTINDVSKAYQAIAYAGNFSNGVGIGAASGALVVWFNNSTGATATGISIVQGTEYSVAITKVDSNSVNLYVNGSFVRQIDHATKTIFTTSTELYIGNRYDSSGDSLADATISEVRLWSDIRDATEINTYKAENALTGSEAGLTALYTFATGFTLNDSSSNSYSLEKRPNTAPTLSSSSSC